MGDCPNRIRVDQPGLYGDVKMAKSKGESVGIELPPLNIATMTLTLIGDSSLICHAWDKKSIGIMLDKQMKKAKAGREAKDPETDYLGSLYPLPGGGYGFPSIAFKSAAVTACTSTGSITKVAARQAFHVMDEFVPIDGEPTMRQDMVRIGMGTADIRHRGEFLRWRATLTVRFNANVLSAEQILNLFNTAGFGVGIGEWRSEKDGGHGLFHVATGEELN